MLTRTINKLRNNLKIRNVGKILLIGRNLISYSGGEFNMASKIVKEIKTLQTRRDANKYLKYPTKRKRNCKKDYFAGIVLSTINWIKMEEGKTMKSELYRLK